jgi:hypothetical protein
MTEIRHFAFTYPPSHTAKISTTSMKLPMNGPTFEAVAAFTNFKYLYAAMQVYDSGMVHSETLLVIG